MDVNMEMKEKMYLVAGLGKSGIGAANLLEKAGADYLLYDSNQDLDVKRVREALDNRERKIYTGELTEKLIDQIDVLVISPGIPADASFVNRVRQRGAAIWGEVELAYRCSKGQLAAITGTNGKTTTTALVGEIFRDYFPHSFVVGNIGIPYTSIAMETTEETRTVAEISSFQLETTDQFHPQVSAVLNITPDHLNRHHTMECYAKTKMKITAKQNQNDICVLNYEDPMIRSLAGQTAAKIFYFSSKQKLETGIYLEGDQIVLSLDGKAQEVMKKDDMNLVGMHNVENVMAAIAIAYHMGVPLENIVKTVHSFKAVPHRIEYVAQVKGVVYYNDSKGTNTDASTKAIQAMTRPTVLIAGGYDKGVDFDDWIVSFQDRIKALVLLGKTREKIRQTAIAKGFTEIYMVDSLEEAVKKAQSLAEPDEVVLLSPACASWDMFKSYEQRGELFKEYVHQL